MILKDFISKLPLDVILKTELLDNKITLPINIEPNKFYKDFKDNIKANTLTDEKALFVCSMVEQAQFKTSIDLLNARLRFE